MKATTILALLAARFVSAHPGEDHDHVKREAEELRVFAKRDSSLLSRCADSLSARALHEQNIARRAATAKALTKKRNLNYSLLQRDLAALQSFEADSRNETGVITSNDPSTLFSANTSCILAPEVTIGPYYVLGEYVRSNTTESQAGIPMHLELQFINVNDCHPIENLLVDIWNVNSTGTYSGIASEAGINTTWLRGVQQSSSSGVVEFDTIFPGHYSGRATHTHLAVHTNATILSNGSYTGGTFSHIGQIFYQEALIEAVEVNAPYSTNTVKRTTNEEDNIAQSQADNNFNPFVQFVYLNPSNIADGLLAWLQIGIDPSANYNSAASYAAYLAADGGHANGNAMGGGAGGSGLGAGGHPGASGASSAGSGSGTRTAAGAGASSTILTATSTSGAELSKKRSPVVLLRRAMQW